MGIFCWKTPSPGQTQWKHSQFVVQVLQSFTTLLSYGALFSHFYKHFLTSPLTRVHLHLSGDHDQVILVFSISFWLHCFTQEEESDSKPLTRCSTSSKHLCACPHRGNVIQLQRTFTSPGLSDPLQTAELWMKTRQGQFTGCRWHHDCMGKVFTAWGVQRS